MGDNYLGFSVAKKKQKKSVAKNKNEIKKNIN